MYNAHSPIKSLKNFDYLGSALIERFDVNELAPDCEIGDLCETVGFSAPLFLEILQLFNGTKAFDTASFDQFSLNEILLYLRKTHKYYIGRKLLEIELSIERLSERYGEEYTAIQLLRIFFSRYKAHLTEHIALEERILFPYIESMDRGERQAQYSLQQFVDSHEDDAEQDISRIHHEILSHYPEMMENSMINVLINQLRVVQRDLEIHALIEDKVLIPRALQLEKSFIS